MAYTTLNIIVDHPSIVVVINTYKIAQPKVSNEIKPELGLVKVLAQRNPT